MRAAHPRRHLRDLPRRPAADPGARRRGQPVDPDAAAPAAPQRERRSSASAIHESPRGPREHRAPRLGRDDARRASTRRSRRTRSTSSSRGSSRGCASRAPTPLVVWDVGMGAAHNAMAAIRACETAGADARARPLHLVSFEHDVASLRLALRHARQVSAPPPPAPRATCCASASGARSCVPIVWTLFEGDFRQHLDARARRPTASSTTRSRPRPTRRCGRSSASRACSPSAPSTTPSSSPTRRRRSVRTAMLGAGFVVARGAPTGPPARDHARDDAGRRARTPRARGRVLLGPEWLEQWRRSDAKFPSDVPSTGRAALTERIEAAPQFRTGVDGGAAGISPSPHFRLAGRSAARDDARRLLLSRTLGATSRRAARCARDAPHPRPG